MSWMVERAKGAVWLEHATDGVVIHGPGCVYHQGRITEKRLEELAKLLNNSERMLTFIKDVIERGIGFTEVKEGCKLIEEVTGQPFNLEIKR